MSISRSRSSKLNRSRAVWVRRLSCVLVALASPAPNLIRLPLPAALARDLHLPILLTVKALQLASDDVGGGPYLTRLAHAHPNLAQLHRLAAARSGLPDEDSLSEAHPARLQGNVNVAVEILDHLAAKRGRPLLDDAHDHVTLAAQIHGLVQRLFPGKEFLRGGGAENRHILHLGVILIDQKPARGELQLAHFPVTLAGGDNTAMVQPFAVANFLGEGPFGHEPGNVADRLQALVV